MMKKEIEEILMRRDGINREEARNLIERCQEEINDIIEYEGTLEAVEYAIEDWLGLEPDYVMAFI